MGLRNLSTWGVALGVLCIPNAAGAVGSVRLSSPSNGAWVSTTPTLQWGAATDAISYTLTVTPATGEPLVVADLTTTSFAVPPAGALSEAAGPYAWRVTAYDAAGEAAETSSWSFFADETPPDPFDLTSPEPNAWTRSSQARVIWNAPYDGGSGIARYVIYVDGEECGERLGTDITFFSLNSSPCEPGEGTHYWAVHAEDAVGNVTVCNQAAAGELGVPFRIDDTAPADPAITGGVFELASSNVPDMYGQPNDRTVDTGLNLVAGESIQISATGTWCFSSCDTECFSVSGRSSPGGAVPTQDCQHQSLIGRMGTGSSFFCIGGGGTRSAPSRGKLYLGANSGFGYCYDPQVTVTITGGRGFPLFSPPDGVSLKDRFPTFSWGGASDQGSGGVHYTLIGIGTTATGLTETTFVPKLPLEDGAYEWSVAAVDAAGNRTDSAGRRLNIDTLRPGAFRLRSPANGACTTLPTPSLCWDLSTGGYGLQQVWLDGEVVASTMEPYQSCLTPDAPLAAGEHAWYVVAHDSAGNWRQSTDTRRLRVDYTPPSAPELLSPADGASLVDPPLFRWAAARDNFAVESYSLYLDGELLATVDGETLSFLPPTDLALGAHTWAVRASDGCSESAPAAAGFTQVACTPDGVEHPCPGYNRGPCLPGTRTCTASGTWSACEGAIGPSEETCNDEDDDCNGIVDDEGLGNSCGGVCQIHPPYLASACDGPDADQCAEGMVTCDGRNNLICVETTPNNDELCNGRDDDCNGIVDDAPGCAIGTGGTGGGGTGGGGTGGSGTGGSGGIGIGGSGTGAATGGGGTSTGGTSTGGTGGSPLAGGGGLGAGGAGSTGEPGRGAGTGPTGAGGGAGVRESGNSAGRATAGAGGRTPAGDSGATGRAEEPEAAGRGAAQGEAGRSPTQPGGTGGGCGCSVPSSSSRSLPSAALLAMAVGVASLRRRRARGRS